MTQDNAQARWFVFAQAGFDPVKSGDGIEVAIAYEAPQNERSSYFRIVATPEHQLYYAALSSQGFKSGAFNRGDAIAPGWADFQISLVQQLNHAQVQQQIVPMMPVADDTLANEGSPALHHRCRGANRRACQLPRANTLRPSVPRC
ncbi:MAG: hypothetical protein AAGH78_18005 [Cyanobacteria bacterium P01_H01_bin.58]